ncbi:phenol hydroxylase [Burkholderia pseudomultivorans]|uniref:Phenol hydroxylase n=1 Tax=Burkholderia pseudomultivorans TaxID=1207504 RepID=A0A6P2MJL1_9BURK|nr:phenol 2-monooxygenase domain-containing protein [Burkholderia pseudomultivorans]VWB80582.1 phenol hydroxylase [Burkholderia pseudomultivorans]
MTYQLTIEPIGQVIDVMEGQTLLDAALRHGIWLPHACCHGLCATCKVQVVDGEFEHGMASPFALMDSEREEGKCLACCATPVSDIVIEAEIESDEDARPIPLRDFDSVVESIEDLTPTIKQVRLRVLDGTLDFQPGQYLNLHVPGSDQPRAFSIASTPTASLIELHIRKVPGGQATTYIHEALQAGQRLRFSGPLGRFYVRKSDARPVIFIAGGSGLSSPKSMVMDMLESGDTRAIHLFQGARNRDELYYAELFEALEKDYPNFKYVPVLSDEPGDSEWQGRRGFVHEAADAVFQGDFREHKAYLCGPPPMIEASIRTLMKGRLFERDIYLERFFSAADAEQRGTRSPLFRNI